MRRSKYNLSHYRLTTGSMGQLLPIGLIEVLPGDTFDHEVQALIRLSPMSAPVYAGMTVRIHHWFVPHRLIWPAWEDFITGGEDGLDNSEIPGFGGARVAKDLLDYYGVPPRTGSPNALPLLGYSTIWNEYYRDEDLQAEAPTEGNVVLNVNWQKDYFTTARPWPEKGGAVSVPVGDGGVFPAPSLDVADVTVNDIRKAFSLQRWREHRARYGSRYTEYLRFLGVQASDARLQKPEYLGGGKVRMSVSEVLQVAPDPAEDPGFGVGDLWGHGIGATRTRGYRRFFEEHGYIHSFVSVRPDPLYMQGVDRHWLKKSRDNFYTPEFNNLGPQTIENHEVYFGGADGTFGYQDRYSEYKFQLSGVSGEFRDVLNYWHLGRDFESAPTLNSDFLKCNPSRRIFNEQTHDPLWMMFKHRVAARRIVRRPVLGGLTG